MVTRLSINTTHVNADEVERIISVLEYVPNAMTRAAQRGGADTLRKISRSAKQQIAALSNVPQKALGPKTGNRYGGRVRTRLPNYKRLDGSLWIGARELPAHRVGKPRKLKGGTVMVGKVHKFPKSFLYQSGGQAIVLERVGRARKPTKISSVKLKIPRTFNLEITETYLLKLRESVQFEMKKLTGQIPPRKKRG